MIQYGIKVSRFPRAPHFYGRAWCYCDDKGVLFDEELSYVLTQEDADLLNMYDEDGGYRAGDKCIRFDTYEALLAEGIRVLHERYGQKILIQAGE